MLQCGQMCHTALASFGSRLYYLFAYAQGRRKQGSNYLYQLNSAMQIRQLLLIGAGSFIGGVLRYILSLLVQQRFSSAFPLGTFTVNTIGCFAIGLVFGFSNRSSMNAEWIWFLAPGVCGGFTTFSAFSNETYILLRDGNYLYACTYILMSVLLGIVATAAGYLLMKAIQ